MFQLKYLNKKTWLLFLAAYCLVAILPFGAAAYFTSRQAEANQSGPDILETAKLSLSAQRLAEQCDLLLRQNETPQENIQNFGTLLKDSGLLSLPHLKAVYLHLISDGTLICEDGSRLGLSEFQAAFSPVSWGDFFNGEDGQVLLAESALLVSSNLKTGPGIALVTEFSLENSGAHPSGGAGSTHRFIWIGAVILFTGLLFGLLILSYLARQNFLYVSKMVARLQPKEENTKARAEELAEAYAGSIQRKTDLQDQTLRDNVLSQLLQGKTAWDGISTEGMLQSHHVEFSYDDFVTVVFYIEDFAKLFENDPVKEVSAQIQTVEFLLKNVVEELMAENKTRGYITKLQNFSVMIISVFQKDTRDIVDSLKYAQNFFRENFGILFSASVSSIHHGLNGIHEAYAEAMSVMEYREFLGGEKIMTASVPAESQNLYGYTAYKEQQLINQIKNGNALEAKSMVTDLIQKSFNGTAGSLEISKCLAYDLVGTMLKLADESGSDSLRGHATLNEILGWQSLDQLQQAVFKFIDVVCQLDSKDRGFSKIHDQVDRFIRKHYMNTELSVALIAENVGLHTSYLSTLYKEHTGEGLLEVISKFRIEKAKQLIDSGSVKLEDIAKKIGYSNTKTFTRVFKKYEGVTPAKYRDAIKKKEGIDAL